LAIGFALRQFRPRKLAGFGELVALVFAIAVAVGNFSGSLGIIGEGNTGVQGDGRAQNQSDYFHLLSMNFECRNIEPDLPPGKLPYGRTCSDLSEQIKNTLAST
jgi:hypothetical protein